MSGSGGCGASGFAGTSASSPQAAGAAADLLGKDPSAIPAGLEAALEQTSIAAQSAAAPSNSLGYGPVELGPPNPTGNPILFTLIYGGVYTASALGGSVSQIFAPPAGEQGYSTFGNATWSPDGSMVAFNYSFFDPVLLRTTGGIATIDNHGANFTPIVSGGSTPSWSPDGSKTVYMTGSGIDTANPDGSNAALIVPGVSLTWPVWSPDGKKIAYLNGSLLEVVNPDGSNPTEVAHGNIDGPPVWSPDSTRIAYSVPPAVSSGTIFVVGVAGGNPVQVATGSWPSWSPDVRRSRSRRTTNSWWQMPTARIRAD